MKIYIAGPYTNGDVAENVRNAISAGDVLAKLGHTVFIPHLTHFWHLLFPHDYKFWMKHDQDWLNECDAILRISGDSPGADLEVEMAKLLDKLVYYEITDIESEKK